MILIDTSVWIEFFKQKTAFVNATLPLINAQQVLAFEPVFSELLYGVRNKREKEIIQSFWQVLPRIDFGSSSMIEAAEYASTQNFLQSGIGLMDAMIIKSVLEGNHLLWTLDKRIHSVIEQKYLYQWGE